VSPCHQRRRRPPRRIWRGTAARREPCAAALSPPRSQRLALPPRASLLRFRSHASPCSPSSLPPHSQRSAASARPLARRRPPSHYPACHRPRLLCLASPPAARAPAGCGHHSPPSRRRCRCASPLAAGVPAGRVPPLLAPPPLLTGRSICSGEGRSEGGREDGLLVAAAGLVQGEEGCGC
jgi:hypothetical protein